MPALDSSFINLEQVDSTNNYAMAKVHEGMAKHADAYFSSIQTEGKGQRGKIWQTGKDLNIALSIVLEPGYLKITQPFQLSAAIALACRKFFSGIGGQETAIKWPNDIYWRDRKAGGILIENVFKGKEWAWSVAGMGINVNQTVFGNGADNAVSLKQITGKNFDLVMLAKKLHRCVIQKTNELLTKPFEEILAEYNAHLYKKHLMVKLQKNDIVFETLIKGVSATGQLLTVDSTDNEFDFGEVAWLL